MLVAAIKYKDAVKCICSEKEHGLRELEMDAQEWKIG